MLRSEAENVLHALIERFPKWRDQCTKDGNWDSEKGGWQSYLESLASTEHRAMQAVDKLWQTFKFTIIRPGHFSDALKLLPRVSDEIDQSSPFVETGWWVVRSDELDQRPVILRAGHGRGDGQLQAIAGEMIEGTESEPGLRAMYGGEWFMVGPGANSPAQARAAIDPEFAERMARTHERMVCHGADRSTARDLGVPAS